MLKNRRGNSLLGSYLWCPPDPPRNIEFKYGKIERKDFIQPSMHVELLLQISLIHEKSIQLLDQYVLNRKAEIALLKALRKCGEKIENLKTDFLYQPKGEIIPYEIGFNIAIGEKKYIIKGDKEIIDENVMKQAEEGQREKLKTNFVENIKELLKNISIKLSKKTVDLMYMK